MTILKPKMSKSHVRITQAEDVSTPSTQRMEAEAMDIKQMLRDYPTYTERIKKLNQRINDALAHKINRDTLKAQRLDGQPHGTGISDPTYQAVETIIDKWDKQIREMADEVNRLIDSKQAVDNALKCLTPTEYRVIELYYFMGMRWEKVAVMANYTWRHCMRLHGQALEKMRRTLKCPA